MTDPGPRRTRLPDRPLLTKPPSYLASMAAKPIPLPPQRDQPPPSASLPSPTISASAYSGTPPLSPFQARGSLGSIYSPVSSASSSPTSSYFPGSSGQAWCGRSRSNSSPGSFPLRRASALASSPLSGSQFALGCVVESISDDEDDGGAPTLEECDAPSTVKPPHRVVKAEVSAMPISQSGAGTGSIKRSHAPAKPLSISVPTTSASSYGYGATSPSAVSPSWVPSSPSSGGSYFSKHSTGSGSFPLRRDTRPSPLGRAIPLAATSVPLPDDDDKGSAPRFLSVPLADEAAGEGDSLGLGLGLSTSPADATSLQRARSDRQPATM